MAAAVDTTAAVAEFLDGPSTASAHAAAAIIIDANHQSCVTLPPKGNLVLFFRYDLCIYGGSRGQCETFVRVTLRSLAFYLSQ